MATSNRATGRNAAWDEKAPWIIRIVSSVGDGGPSERNFSVGGVAIAHTAHCIMEMIMDPLKVRISLPGILHHARANSRRVYKSDNDDDV